MLPPLTDRLAEFVEGLAFERIPGAVVHRAKTALLDFIGAAVIGSDSDSARKLRGLLEELGGAGEASVIGRSARAPAIWAPLANGAMAAVYEVDDVHEDCRIHPGLGVIPAALALAERERSPGTRLIEAIVAGYEVTVRLARAVGVEHNAYWHSTGTAGAVGAAAAACKVLGLPRRQIAGGLGLGATQAAGLIDGIEGRALAAKHFHGGKAAQNGVLAALLAARDYLGSETAIEGEWGFLRAFSRATADEQRAAGDGLGQDWKIMRNLFKPFACCLAAQPAVHAVLDLAAANGFDLAQVAAIDARVHPSAYYVVKNPDPATGLEAKFSLAFCVAAGLVYRDLGPATFSAAALADAGVRRLMHRVTLAQDPGLERVQTRVVIELASGRRLETVAVRRSLTEAEVEPKFRRLVDGLFTRDRADRVVRCVGALEAQPDVSALGSLISVD